MLHFYYNLTGDYIYGSCCVVKLVKFPKSYKELGEGATKRVFPTLYHSFPLKNDSFYYLIILCILVLGQFHYVKDQADR